jgi:hypothetical protein
MIAQATTKEILLTKGQVAIVDEADFEWLSQWKWQSMKPHHIWYARRTVTPHGKSSTVYMHREILRVASDVYVDHIDGNGLNNTRANLRAATRSENLWNHKSRTGSSQYKGVNFHTSRDQWQAQIKFNGKRKWLGYFNTPEEAAVAWDRAARELHGEFAFLNFPEGK